MIQPNIKQSSLLNYIARRPPYAGENGVGLMTRTGTRLHELCAGLERDLKIKCVDTWSGYHYWMPADWESGQRLKWVRTYRSMSPQPLLVAHFAGGRYLIERTAPNTMRVYRAVCIKFGIERVLSPPEGFEMADVAKDACESHYSHNDEGRRNDTR